MKAKNAKAVAQLVAALGEMPAVRRRLGGKPDKYCDAVCLELSAADMTDGVGQGSSAYLYVPAEVGRQIVDQAEIIIRKAIADLGVEI